MSGLRCHHHQGFLQFCKMWLPAVLLQSPHDWVSSQDSTKHKGMLRIAFFWGLYFKALSPREGNGLFFLVECSAAQRFLFGPGLKCLQRWVYIILGKEPGVWNTFCLLVTLSTAADKLSFRETCFIKHYPVMPEVESDAGCDASCCSGVLAHLW